MNRSGFRAHRESRAVRSIQHTAFTGGGAALSPTSVAMGIPKFYSPLHTPSNWQIPTKRKEVYQWQNTENAELMREDLTYIAVKDLVFDSESIVLDSVTGGLIFENVACENLWSGDGNLRKPVHISNRTCNNKTCYRIKTSGYYHVIDVSEEHGIYVLDGAEVKKTIKSYKDRLYRNGIRGKLNNSEIYAMQNWNQKRVRADEVELSDYILTPVPKLKENTCTFDNDLMWTIGLALADGTIGHSSVALNCATSKPEIINQSLEFLNTYYGYASLSQHTESENCLRVICYRSKAVDDFSTFISGKLKDKKLTKEILHLNEEQILHLLGGYFDGDGSFNDQGNLVANCSSKDMADQIYWLCLMTGIKATLNKYERYDDSLRQGGTWVYRLFISASEVEKLLPYMRSNKIGNEYSYESSERCLRFFYTDEEGNKFLAQPVTQIERYLYSGIGYDLQIDPERSYVHGGFKVSNCRFFANNEPKVAAALDWYSQFPITDFEVVHNNLVRKKHFDEVKRRLRLVEKCKTIAYEYYSLGDCFVFADIYCEQCNGSNVIPGTIDPRTGQGQPCPHPGGTFTNITVLNPDWIEVQSAFMTGDNEVIVMMPDNNLKNIVSRKAPKEIYDRIPAHLRDLIASGKPIPLHPMCTTHLAYNRVGYQPYGRSLIMRLFRTLAYKDKLTQAQWIVADRHIVPVRIAKVGSDAFPAAPQDITEIQSQLLATSNDPNYTLITHHAFELDWIGACHTSDTEVLTKRGFLNYWEVNPEDEIATYNSETGQLEYHNYSEKYEYDYDSDKQGDLIRFKGKHYDNLVTWNHKMYAQTRVWNADKNKYEHSNFELINATDVLENSRFLATVNWEGVIPENLETFGLDLDDYLKFVGYFVSEGGYHLGLDSNNDYYPTGIYISQNSNSPYIQDIKDTLCKLGKIRTVYDARNENVNEQLYIDSTELGKMCAEVFGKGYKNKQIPDWVLQLPIEKLKILLSALMASDGDTIASGDKEKYRYSTTSRALANQVQEIVLKLGYNPKLAVEKRKNSKHNDTFRVYWSKNSLNCTHSVKNRNISKESYKGKVWCFEVPNHIFITRRNGKIGIHGNSGKVLQLSKEHDMINQELLDGLMINQALLNGEGPNYASASIGIEALIQRLDSFRNTLAEFIEEKIFRPIAIMQGFYKKNENGEDVPDYPTVKWRELKLRDDTQRKNLMMALNEKGKISNQTLLEYMGLDPDVEIERMRYESIEMPAFGIGQQGGGQSGGGDMGGMGGIMGPVGGGGDMGGMGGGGGDMGGMTPAGAPGPDQAQAANDGRLFATAQRWSPVSIPRITKKKRKEKEEEVEKPQKIMLTAPEQKMMRVLVQLKQYGKIHFPFVPQYKPDPRRRFSIDFAFPHLKLGLEVEGSPFHDTPQKKEIDMEKDQYLAQQGWKIIRFPEEEIKNQIEKIVVPQILQAIEERKQALKLG